MTAEHALPLTHILQRLTMRHDLNLEISQNISSITIKNNFAKLILTLFLRTVRHAHSNTDNDTDTDT